MKDFSILIGGPAGFGIDKAGWVIAGILNRLGYYIYIYRDYPSVIRGGHTFSIIRASARKITSHKNRIDFLLALDQNTVEGHWEKLNANAVIIYDNSVKASRGTGVDVHKILKEEEALEIARNSCLIGSFCKSAGIGWDILEAVFRKEFTREIDVNLKVARRGYDEVLEAVKMEFLNKDPFPILTGNEAMSLGLINAGLDAYAAYPMTPSSGILHFLASFARDFGLKVIHPESEIGAMLMACGFAYAGKKAAVGTSGGGFCLMVEGLSFSGMGELPVVIIVGQRTGPSTGLPTYTAQTELNFVLSAGHGEFTRLIVAPGDAEEAYYWAGASLNLAWQYQIPVIILSDKTLAEGTFSFDVKSIKGVNADAFILTERPEHYKRYLNTATGVSPLAFAPLKGEAVKVNSYEHDEAGISTEDAGITALMQEKRLRKNNYLLESLESGYELVKAYGGKDLRRVILCWGSNKGVALEVGEKLGFRVVQPVVLWPFPLNQFREAVKGAESLICVENNATGQLADLVGRFGFKVDQKVLKYNGRPWTVDELEEKICSV